MACRPVGSTSGVVPLSAGLDGRTRAAAAAAAASEAPAASSVSALYSAPSRSYSAAAVAAASAPALLICQSSESSELPSRGLLTHPPPSGCSLFLCLVPHQIQMPASTVAQWGRRSDGPRPFRRMCSCCKIGSSSSSLRLARSRNAPTGSGEGRYFSAATLRGAAFGSVMLASSALNNLFLTYHLDFFLTVVRYGCHTSAYLHSLLLGLDMKG